jgi:outer membrane protein OmpA-like peptidoglycan-associated protein
LLSHFSCLKLRSLAAPAVLVLLGACAAPAPNRTPPPPPTETSAEMGTATAGQPSPAGSAPLRMSVRLNKAPADTATSKSAPSAHTQPSLPGTSSVSPTQAQIATNAHPIYFEPGADQVTSEGKRILQSLGARAKANRRITFTLVGHTDDTGSTEFDIAHAQRRVGLVAAELQRQGVGARQIRRISHGSETIPRTRCSEENCKALLQRVDVMMTE